MKVKGIIQSAMSAIIVAMVMFGCSSEKQVKSKKDLSLPLNITIYLDLSDRLVRDLTPSQRERDLAIVEHFTKLFQDSCQSTGILKSKHRLRVLFYPAPENTEINTLASALVIDMKNLQAKDKRVELQKMPSVFKNSLAQIYDETLNAKKWLGSDIWGFFSNKKVDDLCIKKGYRNVLVILTDGYLYYELNKQQSQDAYSYVTSKTLLKQNSSMIVKRKGLQGLEVLMLETNPYSPKEHDRLQSVLENWFEGMEIGRFVVSETDLSSNTETVIDNFLNGDK